MQKAEVFNKMAILSTGKEMRKWETGAVRDNAEGKGRCDLLPHKQIGEVLRDQFLINVGKYVYSGDKSYIHKALNIFVKKHFGNWNTALLEVSIHYEEGATKYSARNYELGIPLHCFIDSGIRHYLKHLRGDNEERHDRAVLWNFISLLWTQDNHSKLCDLPFADKGEKS